MSVTLSSWEKKRLRVPPTCSLVLKWMKPSAASASLCGRQPYSCRTSMLAPLDERERGRHGDHAGTRGCWQGLVEEATGGNGHGASRGGLY
jgi:hypothetical protein